MFRQRLERWIFLGTLQWRNVQTKRDACRLPPATLNNLAVVGVLEQAGEIALRPEDHTMEAAWWLNGQHDCNAADCWEFVAELAAGHVAGCRITFRLRRAA